MAIPQSKIGGLTAQKSYIQRSYALLIESLNNSEEKTCEISNNSDEKTNIML